MKIGSIPAWLDKATSAHVEETVNLRDLAVILFGSFARQEERPAFRRQSK